MTTLSKESDTESDPETESTASYLSDIEDMPSTDIESSDADANFNERQPATPAGWIDQGSMKQDRQTRYREDWEKHVYEDPSLEYILHETQTQPSVPAMPVKMSDKTMNRHRQRILESLSLIHI